MPDDDLVYDSALGWIDPDAVLDSLGVTVKVGREYLYYGGVDMNDFRVPRKADWSLLRAVIDDAESRAAEGGTPDA